MIRTLTATELHACTGPMDDAGFGSLETDRGCLPLETFEVAARIVGLTAATRLRQTFVNVFAEPLEAVYVFPLPPRAAVTDFRMTVAGVEIRGRIDERQQARDAYDAAVAAGRHAAIVEEERPDVFTLRVGNIPARAAARVELTLVAPVAVDALEATYRFPLVVAPRYCPGTPLDGPPVGDGIAPDTDRVPDASRITPPVLLPGMKSPVRLAITAEIVAASVAPRASARAAAIGCSLPVEELPAPTGGRLVRVMPGQRLDRDFILRWPVGAADFAVAETLVESDASRPTGLGTAAVGAAAPGEGTFAMTVIPPVAASASARPRDVVFVLDRSGSMEGWKMAAARRAVARAIDALGAADRLAVLAFDDRVEHPGVAPEFIAAGDRNRWQVVEWLARIEARGGTALEPAVAVAVGLAAPRPGEDAAGRDRFVVLVTDGQVGDEDHVLRTLAAKLAGTRLFIVGIDTAVNEGLLGRLATQSGGLAEFVESEERLDAVMDRIRTRIAAPLVTGLTLSGAGIELIPESVVPAPLPDLVAGLPLIVHGRYRGLTPGAEIHITGRLADGGAWRSVATVAASAVAGLGSLWARGRLRQLEDRWVIGAAGQAAALEPEIVRLSTSFGVLCRFTALVAIDDRTAAPVIATRRIVQPVESVMDRAEHLPCMAVAPAQQAPARSRGLRRAAAGNASCPPPPAAAAPASRPARWWGAIDPAGGDPLAHERGVAADLVAGVRPRSGSVADVRPAQVADLLRDVEELLARLDLLPASSGAVAAIAVARQRLVAACDDVTALVALLEALADFSTAAGGCERWWERPAVQRP